MRDRGFIGAIAPSFSRTNRKRAFCNGPWPEVSRLNNDLDAYGVSSGIKIWDDFAQALPPMNKCPCTYRTGYIGSAIAHMHDASNINLLLVPTLVLPSAMNIIYPHPNTSPQAAILLAPSTWDTNLWGKFLLLFSSSRAAVC